MLLVNDEDLVVRSETICEKGTNRSHFFRGMVDKYTWIDVGSSYLASELQAAFLFGRLEMFKKIADTRMLAWNNYWSGLKGLEDRGLIGFPYIPKERTHNAHMFYIKVRNLETRTMLLEYLKSCGIQAAFHYVPLHSSVAGRQFGRFHGEDRYTTTESERLVRLPLWYGLTESDQMIVIDTISRFFD